MANLDDAVRAYHASLTAVETAKRAADERIRKAREQAEAARLALADAMAEAATGGMKQTEIIRKTGYSREQVRTILRSRGVESDRG